MCILENQIETPENLDFLCLFLWSRNVDPEDKNLKKNRCIRNIDISSNVKSILNGYKDE